MSEYDPFNLPEPVEVETYNKHILDSNGLWLFCTYEDSSLEAKCLCGCTKRFHLASELGYIDNQSICINIQCICEGFVQEGTKIIISPNKGQIPKKEIKNNTKSPSIGF